MTLIAATLEAFFKERLITQRNASPRTIAAYRDTLRLLLRFAHEQTGTQPCRLDFADLDAELVAGFLDHLEHTRGNSPRTRNARLAAIHSLYRFAARRHPEHAQTIARVIEIPTKRHERAIISYLDENEIKALLRRPTDHLARPPRPRAAAGRDPNRRSCLGAHRPARRRRQPGHRSARPSHREGTKGTLRDAHRRDRRGPPHLAGRTPRTRHRPAVPEPARRSAHPSSGRLAARQACRDRRSRLAVASRQAHHATHTQAHQRDAAPSRARRHPHDRAVARPREHQINRDLPPRRQQAQTKRNRTHHANRNPARQIQASQAQSSRSSKDCELSQVATQANLPLCRGDP